jgi:hypothetical protein
MKSPTLLMISGLLSFTLSSFSAENGISEEQIKAVIKDVEKAVEKHDPETIIRHLTKDAVITLDLPEAFGGRIVMNPKTYNEVLKLGWANSKQLSYEVKDLNITLSPDKQRATVTNTIHEVVLMNGQTIRSVTNETVTFVSVNGIPKMKAVYGKAKLTIE